MAVVAVAENNQVGYYATMLTVSLLSQEQYKKLYQSKLKVLDIPSATSQQVLDKVNALRKEKGVKPLIWNQNIASKALEQSRSMQQKNTLDNSNLSDIKDFEIITQNVGYLTVYEKLTNDVLVQKFFEVL